MRKRLIRLNFPPSPWFPKTISPATSSSLTCKISSAGLPTCRWAFSMLPPAFCIGQLIGTGNATNLFIAYLVGAGFMIFAAVVELLLGVRAEGQSLENVATPLTAIEEATGKSAAAQA